jgi:anti-anti-sigma factor
MASIETLQPAVDKATAVGGPLVIDLRDLTFMDSTGIHAWTKAAQVLALHGWCIYLHVSGGVVELVLNIAGIGAFPNIHVIAHPEGNPE